MTDYELWMNILLYDTKELERAVKKQKKDLISRKLVDIRAGCNRLLEIEEEEQK